MKVPNNPPNPNSPSADVATQQWVSTFYAAKSSALSPGYEIGYDQITSNVGITASSASTSTTVISGSSHIFDGSPVIAEFFSPLVTPIAIAGSTLFLALFEGATQIAQFVQITTPAASAALQVPVLARQRFTPTSGSHTYSVKGWQSGGTGFVVAGNGSGTNYSPAYLRFTKV